MLLLKKDNERVEMFGKGIEHIILFVLRQQLGVALGVSVRVGLGLARQGILYSPHNC